MQYCETVVADVEGVVFDLERVASLASPDARAIHRVWFFLYLSLERGKRGGGGGGGVGGVEGVRFYLMGCAFLASRHAGE
jgi:hypothetical protein